MLANLRQRLNSWRVLAASGALFTVSQATLVVLVLPLGADMLRVQTTLSAPDVRAILARWEAAGLLPRYAFHYRIDMIHPLWYSLLLAAGLAKGFAANAVPSRWNALLLLPFFAGACDVMENLVHLSFLADRANITPDAVLLGNGAARVKWALAALGVVSVAALAIRARKRHVPGPP